MLKRMLLRKIAVASSILLVMFLLYLFPTNKEVNLTKNEVLEYVYPNDLEVIYLLDPNNYLSQTKISVNNQNNVSKAKDLINALTTESNRETILPNGFKALLPKNTKVLSLSLKDGLLTINFSKEFYNLTPKTEAKAIESLTYTLTSIDGVDKIAIYVNNQKLTHLPHSKEPLPEYLDKNYGINKVYELTSINDIFSYTVYYVLNYNDEVYYTPVTKYVNNENQDKVKIIIENLTSSIIYESNLMSYLDTNVKLLDYEITDNSIKLDFNDAILSDITNNQILEEVMYTIGLSLCDELNINTVIFLAEGREISTFSSKSLDLK